jgi:hypothetical protein
MVPIQPTPFGTPPQKLPDEVEHRTVVVLFLQVVQQD